MDLSKLSEADLSAIASGDMTKVSDEGLTHISSQPPEVSDPRATRYARRRETRAVRR
jgi:hypothetical protein